MKKLILALLVTVIVCSCTNSGSTPADAVSKDTTSAPKEYFPVNDFIKNDISYADSFFTSFKKYTTINNKTDSLFIKPEEFKQLAAEFTGSELSKDALEKDYKETSFMDQATATFNYSTTNSKLPIQRIDVLAKQGESFDKISSIYIEKTTVSGDTTIHEKMYWKTRKSFQVITETTIKAQLPTLNHYKVVWDASE
jgi:hypothetical protein